MEVIRKYADDAVMVLSQPQAAYVLASVGCEQRPPISGEAYGALLAEIAASIERGRHLKEVGDKSLVPGVTMHGTKNFPDGHGIACGFDYFSDDVDSDVHDVTGYDQFVTCQPCRQAMGLDAPPPAALSDDEVGHLVNGLHLLAAQALREGDHAGRQELAELASKLFGFYTKDGRAVELHAPKEG